LLCLGCLASCVAKPDPSLDAIKQALQNEDKDPAAASQALKDNLGRTKDKNLIPFLLDYLRETRQHEKFYPYVLGKIAFYLEQVSEIKSHIHGTIAGPTYYTDKEADADIEQWQTWWDANKDYIYWDEQAQAMKVKPH
jgi:hypothetical protein